MPADHVKLNFALGVESFHARDFASAAKHLEKVHKSLTEVNLADFFYFYGLSLLNTGDFSRCLKVLDEAVSLFPDYTDLIYSQAITRFMLGDIEEAELLLNRCLEMGDAPWEKYTASPGTGSFKAMCSLGVIRARKGDTDKALELFAEAARIPGAFDQAVENIVFLKDKLPLSLDRFLEDKGLLNSRSLGVVSGSLAKMERYEESLYFLALAGHRVAAEPAPRNFANITGAIDLLLGLFYRQACKSFSDGSMFKQRFAFLNG
jgi:tetratricopeptide (TPR) repeat protein